MENDRKIYETYVVNLDNSRLFWLSLISLIVLTLAFLGGLFVGRKAPGGLTKIASVEPVREGQSVSYDNVILASGTAATQYDNLEVYRVLPKDKLTSEDIEHSIPYQAKPRVEKPARSLQKPAIVETRFPVVKPTASASLDEQTPTGSTSHQSLRRRTSQDSDSDSRIPARERRVAAPRPLSVVSDNPVSDPAKPYAVQAASYQNGSTAEAVRSQLASDGFRAFVVKTRIGSKLYFRIRLGPFGSQAKADAALGALRQKNGFSGAYVCRN